MKTLYKDLIKETLRGKSLPRVLINNRMREIKELNGKILALASGNKRPSAYRFLRINKNAEIVSVDISKERNPDFIADLEKTFPFNDNEFDCVTCFNLLEHIFDHRNAINESFRILKKNGRFIGTIPFLGSVHGDPDDYFRYTKSALKILLKDFEKVHIEALGYGPFSVGYYMVASGFPKIFRIPLLFLGILLDKTVIRFKKNHNKDKYVLMYFFECEK